MSTDSSDFLMGGGGASASFENVGDTVTGTIASTEVRQQTDIQSGSPLAWDNGDPRMQLVVTLQTDQKDDADDDGKRNLYVKGSKKPGSKSLHDAVRQAVQAAGAKSLEEGGTLTVSFVGEEPSSTRGFNARKLYEAQYVAPDKAAATGGFLGTAPAQQAPVTGTQPPAPQAPAPAPAAPAADTSEQVIKAQQLVAVGMDDATIAAATGLDVSVVAALRTAA